MNSMIKFDRFPGGKKKAVTMSYDDASVHDKRLVEIFNKNGIKGTFHINSGLIGTGNHLSADEIPTLYKGHEIATHGVYHHSLSFLPYHNMVQEILEDRRALEKIAGYPVRGMSYANGSWNEDVLDAVKSCGIVYSRSTLSTGGFSIPKDFLAWTPTCHHRDAEDAVERFLNIKWSSGYLLYIWGHAHEFPRDNNWELIEGICEKLGNRDDLWYATNIEIYDYVKAQRQLIITVDNDMIINPTVYELWFSIDGEPYKIGPGETIKL